MKLTSPTFEYSGAIPQKYTCEGENINPPLVISDVPEGAQVLVLIIEDPDASNDTWVHWTVWNIDPENAGIEEDSVPEEAIEGVTSFGEVGYGGPCPPKGHGVHHYFFRLYALNSELALSDRADAKELREAMKDKIMEEAELMGTYERV